MSAAGIRYRIVTRIICHDDDTDETHVSTVVLSAVEASEQLQLEAQLAAGTGWMVHWDARTLDAVVCVRDGRLRIISVRAYTPWEDRDC